MEAWEQDVDIAEVYSPVRMTGEARKVKVKSGLAMDLDTGWDFGDARHRDAERRSREYDCPLLLAGSPECKLFSSLQNLSPWISISFTDPLN